MDLSDILFTKALFPGVVTVSDAGAMVIAYHHDDTYKEHEWGGFVLSDATPTAADLEGGILVVNTIMGWCAEPANILDDGSGIIAFGSASEELGLIITPDFQMPEEDGPPPSCGIVLIGSENLLDMYLIWEPKGGT